METKKLSDLNKDILIHLLDYSKYLYEEEKERTLRIEKKVEIFKIFLGGGVLVSIILPLENIKSLVIDNEFNTIIPILNGAVFMYVVSFLLFVLSFIFTVLIYKVQKFERPSTPDNVVDRSLSMVKEEEFLAEVIADYSVATGINHEINDKKAIYLSRALFTFSLGVFSTIVCLVLYISTQYVTGG